MSQKLPDSDGLREVHQMAEEIEAYDRNHHDPTREAAEIAAYHRLVEQFPGQHVAYVDIWDGTTLTRQILAHDTDIGRLATLAHTWPADTVEQVRVEYAEPVNGGLALLTAQADVRLVAPGRA